MKRALVVLAVLGLAAPAFAQKFRTSPRHVTNAAPATVTIAGSPLTIVIGDETSMETYNTTVPGGTGQYFPEDCSPGETADAGVFAKINGFVYGPDFGQHPCGSATGSFPTPWTKVSLSPVTGSGSSGDPFTVTVVVTAGATGLRLTETVTYVNGSKAATIALAFSNTTDVALTWDTFIGADLFLADSDEGVPALVGGAAAGKDCQFQNYTILFGNATPNDGYSANGFGTVWAEIAAGTLSNTVATGCIDNGIANSWVGRNLAPGGGLTIDTGISFTGAVAPVAIATPTLSVMGLTALVGFLALVGYVLSRRILPGA
ncbi:MAG TPA: hypothetical protein VGH97_17525 [Thermoanaerobaculia bacterium]|jgi:hypothetical protein